MSYRLHADEHLFLLTAVQSSLLEHVLYPFPAKKVIIKNNFN